MAPTATIDTASAEELAFRSAWDEFFAAVRRARGRAARERRPGALTLAQFQLLAAFEASSELTVGELALAGGVAPPTATRMLTALERDGIVERRESDTDRRSVLVSPTAKGRRLLREKRKLVAAKQRAIFDGLTPRERKQAESILRRLAVAVEEL
jgi:MarR family transcriptional regulator, organic hydroperoxide resistance regulator